MLYKMKNRDDPTRDYLEKAILIFEEIGAYKFLKQANKWHHRRGSFKALWECICYVWPKF